MTPAIMNRRSDDDEEEEALLIGSETLIGRSEIRKFPRAIAHRGFKAKFPENSLAAFEGAVRAGAHAIETDLRISRDNVVVISHDTTLNRCFGIEGRVIDHSYEYLKTLRTIQPPHVPMPNLEEVLEFMRRPVAADMWLLLDIKGDNDPEIVRLTAEVVRLVDPKGMGGWADRIVLGCWTLEFLALCQQHLPGFPITHIGLSIPYARKFLAHPGVSFNLSYPILCDSRGARFVNDARAAGRDVYAWTINDERTMRWAIRHEMDAICTDDPAKFFDLCKHFPPDYTEPWTARLWRPIQTSVLRFLGWLAFTTFYRRQFRIELEPKGGKEIAVDVGASV